jgi:hypothetical protein
MYGASRPRDLNFSNNMSAVFLDIEKAFDNTCHPRLLYKLSKLQFSTNLMKQRNFRVSVEGEMPTPRYMQAGVSQGSVMSPN